jgi:hypothetical protein
VYPSETVRELCERCLVNPFEKDPPQVSWMNTNLPLSERLTHMNATKPWQLNLAKGEDELLMTVPAGVAIRSKPLRSRRAAKVGAESDAAAVPTFSRSSPAREEKNDVPSPDADADEKPGKVRKLASLGDATANETEKPATGSGSPSSDEGKKRDETDQKTVSDEPPAFKRAEAAANFSARAAEEAAAASARDDVDDLAEHAAAGLMAVAAGIPMQKKRGRGRPRKIAVQEPSRPTRDVPLGLRGGGFPGRSVAAEMDALSPAFLAAYEAGRADAAAAVLSATAGLAASPVSVSARAGANPPSVADIIDKFYRHQPSTTAARFPLASFRVAAGDGLASGSGAGRGPTTAGDLAAGAGAASFNAGSAANEKALWQWNQTIAMLSGQAGHPAGAFVDLSSPYASLFAPPSTAAELHRVAEANERWLSEVSSSVDEVRLAAAAVASEGDSADPSVRAAFVARVERVLRRVDEKKSQIPVSQRVEVAKSVLELRAWVKKQLQARIAELSARAWEPKPEAQEKAEKEKAAAKDKGKAPAAAEETPAFSLLANVAAASDGKRGAFAVSSDSDPTEV